MAIQIKFGSYTFPATIYPASESSNARIKTAEIPRREGLLIQPVGTDTLFPQKEKVISLRGMVTGEDSDAFRVAYDALVAAIHNGEQNLTLHSDRYIPAKLSAFTTDYDPTSVSRYCHVAFDMVAMDPFWLSSTEYSDTWTNPTNGATRAIDVGGGDVDALPTFAITPAATGTMDIEIAVTLHGVTRSFSIYGSRTSGVVHLINSAAETVTKQSDGTDKMALFDGEFLKLGTGSNTLTYTLSSGIAVSQIVTTWRRRWL